jgi:hypothetical protein
MSTLSHPAPPPRTAPPSGAGRARRRDDAIALWAELRHAAQERFQEYGRAQAAHRALPRRRLLLALELMWKLEEQALLPALMDADAGTRDDAAELDQELNRLRDLADLVREGGLEPTSMNVVLAALDGMNALRALRFERALDSAVRTRRLDGAALAREMEAWLGRWREEVTTTGDIEDEELDPVGRPPR